MSSRGRRGSALVGVARLAHRRSRKEVMLIVGGALTLVVIMTLVMTLSPLFSARSVEVTGTQIVSVDEVVAAAEVPIGKPLALLDVSGIMDRVSQIPAVGSVDVTRHLSGVVEIKVVERTPVYTLSQAEGFHLVDATGVAYQKVAEPVAGAIVVKITGGDVDRLRADAAIIVQALPEEVRNLSPSITTASADGFTIALSSGATVMWGSSELSEEKAEVIVPLLNVSASYYDVSSPSHPATR